LKNSDGNALPFAIWYYQAIVETTKGGEGSDHLSKNHSIRNNSGLGGMEGFSPQVYVCSKITCFNLSNMAQRQQTHICCQKFVDLCGPSRMGGLGELG